MTSYSIAIDLNALQAVACVASAEETRYYLQGVLLEYGPAHIHMTATDGRTLITLRQPYQDGDAPRIEATPVIVPLQLIGKLKLAKRAKSFFVTMTVSSDNRISFDCGTGETISAPALDATYPAYRNVIPETVSGELAQFCANVLASLAKARAKLIGCKNGQIHILHNGENPALVSIAHGTEYEAVAVAMPYQENPEASEEARAAVSWARAPLTSPLVYDETDRAA